MDKYECIACGYIYDPELGDPTQDIAPVHLLKTCPKIGFAPIVALARTNSKRFKSKQTCSKKDCCHL